MSKTQYSAWQLRLMPFLSWKHRVTAKTIRADLISGLTVAIVVVPQAVAFASIAGMPPQYGLYAGMIPPIIAALFGSSWHLMSGPTTAASIVLLSSLSVYAEPMTPEYVGLALTLTFMVGVIELVLGLARMGTLVNFISHSVVVGFTTGAAILIASKQLKNFFGVPIPRGGNLFETLGHFFHQVPHTNGYILAIATLTLVSGLVVKKLYPKIPFLIVALLAGSFFSGYVATGSFNRTSLNYQAGAKTPMSAMTAGFLEIFIVLAIAPLVAYLPTAAMAGILFIVAWGLIDIPAIKHIFSSTHSERAIFSLTFLSCLLLDLEFAIMAGILLSLVLYLMRASKPRIVARIPNPSLPNRKFSTSGSHLPECPQLHILRIDGSLFFGSVAYIRETFARLEQQHPEQTHLAIVAQGISFVDIAGADALANEAERRRAAGGGLYLINVKSGLWESLEECHALDKINPNHIFRSKSAALHAIFQKLDKSVCRNCSARTFTECATIESTAVRQPVATPPRRIEIYPEPALEAAPDAEAARA